MLISLKTRSGSMLRLLTMLIFLLSGTTVQAAMETFSTGAFIVNMGVVPQTVGNGLKPYGMIYNLLRAQNVPVKWVINQNKIKDGTDFTYNGVAYRGGTFIVAAEYRTAAVNTIINTWTAQGVVGTTTTSPLTVDVTSTITTLPKWTLDAANGGIAQGFLTAAGINNTLFPGAFNWKAVSALDCCDDFFVMPHADPTWATHSRLYSWNRDCLGSIWAGCHAVSALENAINPANTTQQMNFLSQRTNVTAPTPWPNNSLTLWGQHSGGSVPYTQRLATDPVAQYMGSTELAHLNGSEQIYIPRQGTIAKWNPNAKIISYDPTQVNVPTLQPDLSNAAVVEVYGRGFDSLNRGYVMYQSGHNIGGTAPANIAAQRVFFNFSFFQAIPKAPVVNVSGVSGGQVVQGGSTINGLSVSASSNLAGVTFTYQWVSACGGTFSNPTGQTTNFTAPGVVALTNCAVTCKVTDNCGRVSFQTIPITVVPPPVPPVAVNDAITIPNGCNPGPVTLNVLANDTDPQSAPITFDSLITATASPANAGTWTALPNGTVTFTPDVNFGGTASIQYIIHNSFGGTATATITISVGTPDANGCYPNAIYAPQDILMLNLTDNFVSQAGTGAALNGTALDDAEDTYAGAATDYLNFGTNAANNLVLSTGGTLLRAKDSVNLYWSKGNNNTGTITIDIGTSAAGPWTNAQVFTNAVSGTGAAVSLVSSYALPTGTSNISHIRIRAGSNGTNSAAAVWLDAVEYEYLNCVPRQPQANNDSYTVLEDLPSVLSVLDNDADPEGTALTVKVIVQTPVHGTVSINNNNTLTYVNTNDYSGVDSFSYQVCNVANKCAVAKVYMNVFDDVCPAGQYKPEPVGGAITKVFQYQFAGANAATANPTVGNFRDSWLDQASGGNDNKGGAGTLEIGKIFSGTKARRSIFYFNTSEIPAGAIVTSASFSVLRRGGDGNTQTINLHALNNSWVENQVTWLISSTGNNWVPAGGNFGGVLSSTVMTSSNVRYNWNVTSLAQSWVSTPANNFGVLLKTDELLDKRHQVYAKEDGTLTRRPSLTVTYVVPSPCSVIPNRAPLAQHDAATTTSSLPVSVAVLNNDLDPDGNSLSLSSVISATNGSAVVNGNNVVFTPTFGFNGGAIVTYSVSDGTLLDTARIFINVTNSAPVAVNDLPAGGNSGAPQVVNVGTNDSDPEGGALTYSIYDNGNSGTATLAGSVMTYTPNAGFTGSDTVYYEVSEIVGGCSQGLKDSAYVIFTVLNQPPVGTTLNISGLPCQSLTFNLLAGATDPEGGILSVNSVSALSNPLSGSLTNNNDGTVTFQPATGFTGNVSFTYTLIDNGVAPLVSAPATANISITAIPNNAPIALNDFGDTIQTGQVLYYSILDNDSDPDNNIISLPVITVGATNGTATILPNGLMQYTPNAGFFGLDSVTYQICDSIFTPACALQQSLCTTAKLYVYVKAPNTVLGINDENSTWAETPVSGGVLGNDVDPEGNTPISFNGYIIGGNAVLNGSVTVGGVDANGMPVANAGTLTIGANGTYTFTPAPGFTGTVSVPYALQDNAENPALDTAMLVITVSPLPNSPVNSLIANNDENTSYGSPVSGNVTVNDSDPQANAFNVTGYQYDSNGDGTPDANGTLGASVNIGGVDLNGNPVANAGSLVMGPNGTYTFTPAPGFFGNVEVTYTICDNGTPVACTNAVLSIDVIQNINGPSNDPPVAGDDFALTLQNGTANGNFVANDSDPNGNPVSLNGVTIVTGGPATPIGAPVTTQQGGTVQFFSNGTYVYTPPVGYTGPDQVNYTLCDVTVVNPQPLCDVATIHFLVSPNTTTPDINATFVNVPVSGNVSTNDNVPEGSTYGTPSVVPGNPGPALPVINPDGTYTFTSAVAGEFNFLVPVCPPGVSVNCPLVLLTITVTEPNSTTNPPVANTDLGTTQLNTPITLNTLANDQGGALGEVLNPASVTITDQPNNGTATVNPVTGQITYTPNPGFTGTDTLVYQVCDVAVPVQCATAYQIITVLPAGNPNTTAAADDYNIGSQGNPVNGSVLLNDTDPQGHAQTVTPQTTTIPGVGTLVLNSNGTYTFTPVESFTGPVEFPYTVCDNGTPQACTQATLHILIHPFDPQADINATFVNVPVSGNLTTNDNVPEGTTYGAPTALPGNPGPAMPVINPNGTYTFTSSVPGVFTFLVPTCPPGQTVNCPLVLLTITVADPNSSTNPPVANTDLGTTPLNTPITLNTLANDLGGNLGEVLNPASVTITDQPNNGTATVNPVTGQITYTPNPGFTGTDTLIYQVCDIQVPVQCATAYQIITVLPSGGSNTTWAADDYNAGPINTAQNGNVLTNDTDPQGNAQTVTPQTTTIPGVGTLVLNSNGTYTFTPATGYTGPAQFVYTVCDNGTPQACTEATLYLLVSALQSPVPVVLSHFNATAGDCAATLSWTTAQEINVSHFEIERMNAAGQFELLARVDAKGGNLPTKYNYDDRNAARGNRTYRLRMVDIDGQFAYSPAQTVFVNCHDIRLYPNPSVSDPSLSISTSDDVTFSIKMVDGTGRMLFERSLSLKNESRIIQLPVEHLADGIYSVLVNDGSQTKVIRYQKTSK